MSLNVLVVLSLLFLLVFSKGGRGGSRGKSSSRGSSSLGGSSKSYSSGSGRSWFSSSGSSSSSSSGDSYWSSGTYLYGLSSNNGCGGNDECAHQKETIWKIILFISGMALVLWLVTCVCIDEGEAGNCGMNSQGRDAEANEEEQIELTV